MTIDEAIKVAEAATPGRWIEAGAKAVLADRDKYPICHANLARDAAHIAKFNPVTVLALLRFVQAWDESVLVGFMAEDNRRMKEARTAVTEALK